MGAEKRSLFCPHYYLRHFLRAEAKGRFGTDLKQFRPFVKLKID